MSLIKETTYLFIDGLSLNNFTKTTNNKVHFDLILSKLNEHCQIVQATYYTIGQPNNASFFNFIRCLQCFSYKTFIHKIENENIETTTLKGNLNISLATEMGIAVGDAPQIILITGDPALIYAASRVRNANVRVCILGCNPNFESLFKRHSDFYEEVDLFLPECFEKNR